MDKQLRLTCLSQSLFTPPTIESMASEKVLNIVSTWLRMNFLLLHKITLNYNVLHLLSRHTQWSLLLFALPIIENDGLFPHSWQPPVSLVLFWGIRYEILPAKPFPFLAYAVITPFWRKRCAIYSSARLTLSNVSRKLMARIFSFWAQKSLIPRRALSTCETLSMPI